MARYRMNVGIVTRWQIDVEATDEQDAARKVWQRLPALVGKELPAKIEILPPSHDTDALGKPVENLGG